MQANTPVPDDYRNARPFLFPEIRDTWEIAKIELLAKRMPGGDTLEIPYLCLAESFAAVIVYAKDSLKTIIDFDQVRRWGLDVDTVFDQALEGLNEKSPGEFATFRAESSEIYESTWKDGFDAARVLFPEMLRHLPVRGEHAIFMPNNEILIVTGRDDSLGLKRCLEILEQAQKEGSPLPPLPVLLHEGLYREFRLPSDHSLFERFERLRQSYFERIYEEQSQVLKDTDSPLARDTFIARYTRLMEGGKTMSLSSITEGYRTLLPRTDLVSFTTRDSLDPVASAEWESVAALEDDGQGILEDIQIYPPRYLVQDFPTNDQLDRLGTKTGPGLRARFETGTEVLGKKCLECQHSFPRSTVICPHDGTQLSTVLVAPLSGTLLGDRYELMDEIGRGGMGVIYRAVDRLSPGAPPVAVKLLLNDATENDIIRNRFLVEARAASSLNHPNVIKVQEFNVSEDGLPYMVMEFLSGKTLDDLLEEGHLDLPETIALIIQVCDALGHAHRHNVVHRDVKPSNIVVVPDEDGQRKAIVVDFGIAKIFTQPGKTSLHLTKTGQIFGSPLYMSPEQCMGQKLDARADIYALGCVLYQCVAGQSPFDGDNMLSVIFQHINDEPERFATSDREKALESIILRALAKSPEDRFQSMTDLRRQLEHCLELITDPDREESPDSQSAQPEPGTADGADPQFLYFKELADEGMAAAQLELAVFYRDGIFVEQNRELAFDWCLKAASQEHPLAMAELASMYFFGTAIEIDYDKAYYWAIKAAAFEQPFAISLIGHMLESGKGVEKNFAEAWRWYERAADLEDIEAQKALGNFYYAGHGCDRDIGCSIKWFTRAANQGDQDAQLQLGLIAFNNDERLNEPDFETAVRWFSMAADQGNTVAMRCLSSAYDSGNGVKEDPQEALSWMQTAAELNDPEAIFWIGRWHSEGSHTLKRDRKAAFRYFRKAAELGSINAHFELAMHYLLGEGVAINYDSGLRHLNQAAEDGHRGAIYQLGLIHALGQGVPRDEKRALELITSAAKKGEPAAQYYLSEHYEQQGDETRTRFWRDQALEQGYTPD
ncbi:MAG: SEL1-like repeat protein [Cyanobacteria bacterium HKST-UBA02]|nr:SEL1-like repeat protein [Cyanobacteria bacterium HKST-UBA02]